MTDDNVRIVGAGLIPFGKHPEKGPLELMAEAADLALADAGMGRADIDGLITGYATTLPHLMIANLFAEHYGLQPRHVHAAQIGGATGTMILLLARHLVVAGAADNILVVAGENRLTGQSRDDSIRTLAQVGHDRLEVPTGATVPAYYAMLAERYFHETGATEADLAELAVLMREHARLHPGAHLTRPITTADVLASKPIATPLKLMDCCPISDGACAFIVSRGTTHKRAIRIAGYGEGHTHQHTSAAPDDPALGARLAAERAFAMAGRDREDIGYLGIYDSFTATLAILLEATGFCEAGQAGRAVAEGRHSRVGRYPLNLHGGLLSYGHCGVAGGMAMIAEAITQLRGEAKERQAPPPEAAFVHADGGVLSAHVSLILERTS